MGLQLLTGAYRFLLKISTGGIYRAFFLIVAIGNCMVIVYCYISEERDALLNENDNWITSDSELI
jgi:hypothetical protein